MLVHTVFFWLKQDLTEAQRQLFDQGVRHLTTIPSVRQGFVGKPAATDRPVIDRTYSYGLTILCDDLAAHEAYQADPIHQQFLAECGSFWSRVQIYDAE